MAARSLAGDGPVVAAPAHARVLVIAPHPDDETIGCGGTAALLAASGSDVEVLILSAGEASVLTPGATASQTATVRKDEARAACEALGVRSPRFAAIPDGRFNQDRARLAQVLGAAVAETRPHAIFVPWPLDGHDDHRAVPVALSMIPLPAGVELWCYEVWAALPANRIVDVTQVWDKKLAALACHHGRDAFDLDAHLALQRWRSIHGLDGFGHAEAFLVLAPDQLRTLVQVTTHSDGRAE